MHRTYNELHEGLSALDEPPQVSNYEIAKTNL